VLIQQGLTDNLNNIKKVLDIGEGRVYNVHMLLDVTLHILAGIGTMVVGASLTFSYLTLRDALKN